MFIVVFQIEKGLIREYIVLSAGNHKVQRGTIEGFFEIPLGK